MIRCKALTRSSKNKLQHSEWGEIRIKTVFFFSSLQETSENHPMSLQFTSQLTFHLLGNYRRSRLFWRRGGRFPWWSAALCLHSARRNKIEKYELKWKGNDVPRLYLVISCCHLSFHWKKLQMDLNEGEGRILHFLQNISFDFVSLKSSGVVCRLNEVVYKLYYNLHCDILKSK